MRVSGWHDDRFPFVQQVFRAVNSYFTSTIQTGNKSISTRFMGADLLALCKGEQRDTHRRVLRQRFADNLPLLLGYLLFQHQDL